MDAESFERSLRLVISFGSLKRQTFVSALEERLAPPLKKVCVRGRACACVCLCVRVCVGVCVWGGGLGPCDRRS